MYIGIIKIRRDSTAGRVAHNIILLLLLLLLIYHYIMSSTPHYYSYYIIIVATLVLCVTLVCRYRYYIHLYCAADVLRNTHTHADDTQYHLSITAVTCVYVFPPAGPLADITTTFNTHDQFLVHICVSLQSTQKKKYAINSIINSLTRPNVIRFCAYKNYSRVHNIYNTVAFEIVNPINLCLCILP